MYLEVYFLVLSARQWRLYTRLNLIIADLVLLRTEMIYLRTISKKT
jgi:hypothetical protein